MASSNINQRRITSMNRFAERYSHSRPKSGIFSFMLTEGFPASTQNSDTFIRVIRPGRVTDVQLHLSNNAAETAKIIRKCIVECGNDSIDYSTPQKCAFYLSVLLGFLPSLKPHILNALVDAGARVELIETQEQRARVGFVLEQGIESSSSSVNMCVTLGSSETYQEFMRNRTKELKAHALVPPKQEVHIAFKQEEASLINSVMGFKYLLKKAVLEHILEVSQNRNGPFAAVCKYLLEVLEWNGMESLVSIVDNLVLPKSPALVDLRIADELQKLVLAFKKVTACSMPQYFRILAPPIETFMLWRSRFPTIIALAQSIRGRQYNNNRAFSESDLVKSLTIFHEKHMLTAASEGVANLSMNRLSVADN